MSALSIGSAGMLLAQLETHAGWDGQWYQGTETELVAAGLMQPEWAPGRHGNNKTSQRVVRYANGEVRLLKVRKRPVVSDDDTFIEVHKSGVGQWRVLKHYTPSEKARQQQELDEKVRREHEARQSTPEEWNPELYLISLQAAAWVGRGITRRLATGQEAYEGNRIPAHKISGQDLARVERKFDEIAELIRTAKVEPINHAIRKRPTLTLVKGGHSNAKDAS